MSFRKSKINPARRRIQTLNTATGVWIFILVFLTDLPCRAADFGFLSNGGQIFGWKEEVICSPVLRRSVRRSVDALGASISSLIAPKANGGPLR